MSNETTADNTTTSTAPNEPKVILSKSGKTHEEILAELRKFCELNNSPKTLAAIEKLMTSSLDLYNKIAAVYFLEGTTVDNQICHRQVCHRVDGQTLTEQDGEFFLGEEVTPEDLMKRNMPENILLAMGRIYHSGVRPDIYDIAEEFGVFNEVGSKKEKDYTGRIPVEQFRFSIDGEEYGILTEYIGEEVNSIVDQYIRFYRHCRLAIDFELMNRKN